MYGLGIPLAGGIDLMEKKRRPQRACKTLGHRLNMETDLIEIRRLVVSPKWKRDFLGKCWYVP
jgi:hypothetical protein